MAPGEGRGSGSNGRARNTSNAMTNMGPTLGNASNTDVTFYMMLNKLEGSLFKMIT